MIVQPVPMKQQRLVLHERRRVIDVLAEFRQEWQALTEGQSLIDVQASVGLILVEIAEKLELNEREKSMVLGPRLIIQANAFGEQKVRVKES